MHIFAKNWGKERDKPPLLPPLLPLTQHQPEVVALVHLLLVEVLTIVIKKHHPHTEVQGVRKRRVADETQAHPDQGHDQGHVIDPQKRVVIEVGT